MECLLGNRADGRQLIATGSEDSAVRIWDPDSGQLLHTLSGHEGSVYCTAWGHHPDGRLVLAAGGSDRTVRIWDAGTGQHVRTIVTSQGHALGWATLPRGRQVLASAAGEDRTAEVWDVESGIRLASVPGASNLRQGIALVWDSAGDLLLVVAHRTNTGGPVRVWRIATGESALGTDGPARDRGAGAARGAGLSRELLRLGRSGLWPPLGLLADLVTLTGPETFDPARPSGARGTNPADVVAEPNHGPVSRADAALCDTRLAALAVEPGMARLRAVGWGPAARVSMAALLASSLAIPEQFTPPPGVSAPALRDALARAVAGHGSASAWHVPIGDLRAAAAEITDRTIALLQILGPAACAADPLLPARLAHRIPELPVLTPRELRLLTSAGAGGPATGRETATGTLRYSPGTAGLARTGPLTRLLPTQLALPRDLLTIRLAENQLLYRQHRAPAPPAPEPVTIILDTSPPTYGPARNTLRLATHLLAAALWAHDQYPSLITLANPAAVTELRAPADVIGIWAGATLEDPAATVAAARATAAGTGQPVVFASHFRTARDCGYRPGPAARLLTAHHTPEQPPPPPASAWHAHLPPNPAPSQLAAAIALLLAPHAENGN
jgi:WD domain, G-beta repeat